MKSHRSGGGFTLVELLVVVAIISLLVSLMLPALAKARMAARSVECLSRLRSIGMWGVMYAQDWNGILPTSGGQAPPPASRNYYFWQVSPTKWQDKCPDYVGSSWKTLKSPLHCPQASIFSSEKVNEPNNRSFSYALEQKMGGGGQGSDTTDTKNFPVPTSYDATSSRVWFADASGKYQVDPLPSWASGVAFYFNEFFQFKYRPGTGTEQYTPWPWREEYESVTHPGRSANVLFGDAHGESVQPQDPVVP